MSNLISFKQKDLAGMYNATLSPDVVLYTKPEVIRITKDKTFTLAPVYIGNGDKEPTHIYPESGIVFCKGTVMGASPTFIACYEIHVIEIEGDKVLMHGHEEIIRFDMNDVANTLKVTYTR